MGGSSGSTIDGFAAIWITQDSDPGNAGANLMAFDNINIVPEPSTFSLLTLTGPRFCRVAPLGQVC